MSISTVRYTSLRELRQIARGLGIRRYSTLHYRALVDRIELERRTSDRSSESGEPAIPTSRRELSEMSVTALKAICRRLRVVHYYRMNKATLIDCVLSMRRDANENGISEDIGTMDGTMDGTIVNYLEPRPEPVVEGEENFLSAIDIFDDRIAELLPAAVEQEEPQRRSNTVQFNVLKHRRSLYSFDFVLLPILTELSTLPANHEFYFEWKRSVRHFNDFLHGSSCEFCLSPHIRVTQQLSGHVRFSYVGTESYATVKENDCESLWTLLLSRPRTEGAIIVGRNNRRSTLYRRMSDNTFEQLFVDAYSRTSTATDVAPTEEDMKIEDDLDEKIACRVCLIRRKTHAFVPCGHHACCYLCIRHPDISKCVVCRRPVNGCLKIYDS